MLATYYIYFVVYSFLGWIYESLFYSVQFRRIVNTGFLHGCLCPIYGLACVANLMFLNTLKSSLLIFMISMTAISAIEYIVSAVLENMFDKRWWDYSQWPMNINGRISLFSSLAFGIMSLVQLRVIHPYIEGLVESVSENVSQIFILTVSAGIAVDLILSIRTMDDSEDRLWFIDEESERIRRTSEKLTEYRRDFSSRCTDMRERIRDRINK